MKHFSLVALLVIIIAACERKTNDVSVHPESDTIRYDIIVSDSGRFGYDILIHDKVFIHQPVIPGLSGKKGFRSEDDAEKVARLVIDKLRDKGGMPSVSEDDLRRLEIDIGH